MTRSEQKEELKSLCIWTEEGVDSFHASFLAHYYTIMMHSIDAAMDTCSI